MRKYENVKIDKLTPYEKNARTHSKAQVKKIAESIKEFGFINPVLVDADLGIIAGHGRVEGAKLLGMEEVPCLFVEDLTEAQKRAYIIADNKLALDAGWDFEILSQELLDLDGMDFNLELTGFDLDEIDDLINIEEPEDVVEDEFEAELPEEPRSKLGEIYQLGRHRLMVGDSTKEEDVLKLTDNQLVDMLLTDPPYNVDYTGSTKDALKIANDNMDDKSFRAFLKDAFSVADSVMKPGAVFYIWHADSEGYNFRGACRDTGWQVRQCLIWNKNSMVMGRQDYHWKHEPCLYGWKDGAGHLWASDRKQTTVKAC
ncbi:MAG: ParB N-terminal domain-containing protein [Anaerovoracaceae bacterium]